MLNWQEYNGQVQHHQLRSGSEGFSSLVSQNLVVRGLDGARRPAG